MNSKKTKQKDKRKNYQIPDRLREIIIDTTNYKNKKESNKILEELRYGKSKA